MKTFEKFQESVASVVAKKIPWGKIFTAILRWDLGVGPRGSLAKQNPIFTL